MGLNTFGRMFMPKNTAFYDLFESVAVTVNKMGGILKTLVNEPDYDKRASLTPSLKTLNM